MTAALAKYAVSEAIRRAIPDGTGSVSAWAEQNRYVDRGARKGRWSNSTVPFAVAIMDAATEPDIREVVFMKSAQVGGSEILANIVGYHIAVDPTEIAYVAEKEDKTRAWMIESFDSMVRATPTLAAVVKTADEDNNQRVKRFPGGSLHGLWATSPAELSSRPLQVLLFDERAAYQPTKEGDAVKLGEARTKTYSGFEKIYKVSTPRTAGDDADIEADFLRGDKRQYWVPCPSCESLQILEWKNVHWTENDPETAEMACVHCGIVLEWDDLQEMLEKGRWIKDADLAEPFWPEHETDPTVASFRINQLYSPFVPWSVMVRDFLEAKKKGPNSLQMQTWVNTSLGEPWRPHEKIDYMSLTLNRDDYAAEVPDGVLLLTAACDVQGNRLEYEIVGWGRDDESWSIEYGVIDGDPGQDEVWDELTEKWTRVFAGESRDYRVQCAFIDSGGHHTQQVYKFAKRNAGRKWFACKGVGDRDKPIVGKRTWVECRLPGYGGKVPLFLVGTNAAKDDIFSKLKIAEPGPGYCHFPRRDEYDDAYLRQLCSEKKVLRARLGVTYYTYEKVSANARNEALDLRVYATAARVKLNPNYEAIARRRLQHIEAADAPEIEGDDEQTSVRYDPTHKPNTPEQRRRKFRVIDSSKERL
jgi:phage terminase large subunit GpA-like protein